MPKCMHAQDAREKLDLTADSALAELASRTGATDFTGYENLRLDCVAVLQLLKGGAEVEGCYEGDKVDVVLPRTPFYAESGGQVGDVGTLKVCTFPPLFVFVLVVVLAPEPRLKHRKRAFAAPARTNMSLVRSVKEC